MTDSATNISSYGRHQLDRDDLNAVRDVLDGGFLTGGPAVMAFEKAFANRVQAEFAGACSSGTAALHLAALALELGPDDTVVVPTLTFLATANAARFVGAEVAFADVDPNTGLMGIEPLISAIQRVEQSGRRASAVFPVHLNGQCDDMSLIRDIASERNIRVVEDACHALGGAHDFGPNAPAIGSTDFSDMACFSFHPVKTIAMGEGGVVTTNDSGLYEKLVSDRSHGVERDPVAFVHRDLAFDDDGLVSPWYYEMPRIGFNYRASDIHCALGLSQLQKLNEFVAKRDQLVRHYDTVVDRLAPFVRPIGRISACRPAWHLYVVLIDISAINLSRGQLMRRLQGAGIGTQVQYIPVHLQPYYQERYGPLALPGADAYYSKCLSLPLSTAMSLPDVEAVGDALEKAIAR